jgi:hypothetical protein
MKITPNSLEISELELNMIGYFKVEMKTPRGDWYIMGGSSADGPRQAAEIKINGVSFVPVKRD